MPDPTPELIFFSISPFSARAKWALDVAGTRYTVSPWPFSPFPWAHLPLRLRIGKLRGQVTAPILLTSPGAPDNKVLMDSTAIARWADAHSATPGALFPPGQEEETSRWVAAADELLSIYRRELAAAGREDDAVRDAFLPQSLTGAKRAVMRLIRGRVFGTIADKYGQTDAGASEDKARAQLAAARERLAAAAAAGGPRLLLPSSPSAVPGGRGDIIPYADIALSVALLKLSEPGKIPLNYGEAAGKGLTVLSSCPACSRLVQEFGDLVEWAEATKAERWPKAVAS